MTVNNIDVDETIDPVMNLIAEEKDLSLALKSSLEVLLLLVTILANRFGLNSKNSSKASSVDPNRPKEPKRKSERRPGAQKGRNGNTLKSVSDPGDIKILLVDRSTLPEGRYRDVGYEARQVIDLDISSVVTEYRAHLLTDSG